MRNILIALLALGLVAPAMGQEADSEAPPVEYNAQLTPEERAAKREEMRARWEAMSEEEREAARAERKARKAEHRAKMKERWDSMSEEERAAAREKYKERRKHRGEGGKPGHRGKREQGTPDA